MRINTINSFIPEDNKQGLKNIIRKITAKVDAEI